MKGFPCLQTLYSNVLNPKSIMLVCDTQGSAKLALRNKEMIAYTANVGSSV